MSISYAVFCLKKKKVKYIVLSYQLEQDATDKNTGDTCVSPCSGHVTPVFRSQLFKIWLPPSFTLFPYTTLFRSSAGGSPSRVRPSRQSLAVAFDPSERVRVGLLPTDRKPLREIGRAHV